MEKLCVLVSIVLMITNSFSQSNYDDVAVIINYNSDESIEIGTYFAEKRLIPEENLIYINCLNEEVVDTSEFNSICSQVKTYLEENNLSESINYLVTTRGIPVNISYGDSCIGQASLYCRSLDNQLTMINSSWAKNQVPNILIENPYLNSLENFSFEEFEFYLVTRLDGLEKDSILSLIDKTGPNCPVVKEDAEILIDFAYPDTSVVEIFSNIFADAIDFLNNNDWNLTFDPDTHLVTNKQNVLIYAGMIYDTNLPAPDFGWLNGSFLNTILTYWDYIFYYDGEDIQYSFTKLMNTGASGGGGYVNGYYASTAFKTRNTLFKIFK